MGFLSKFEGKMEDTVEGAAERMGASPLSPVQIAKKAEKQMRREKMVGAGKQYAPTLYTVLVSQADDERLFGYYPTLAGETETYLSAKAAENGLVMDGQPLVRFIADEGLRHGKFEVIAEMVAAPLVAQLRQEEMERYGIAPARPARQPRGGYAPRGGAAPAAPRRGAATPGAMPHAAGAGADEYLDEAAYARGGDRVDVFAAAAPAAAPLAAPADPAGEWEAVEPRTMMFDPPQAAAQPDAAPQQAWEAYLYDATNDRAFTLTGKPMSIGRESRNDIVVPDINASRRHAEIRMDPSGAWIMSDLGSTNGTFVNGRQIKSAPLQDADRIIIGTTELEFQLL